MHSISARPPQSTTCRAAESIFPTSTIFPCEIPTSPRKAGFPVPSTIDAPRTRRSSMRLQYGMRFLAAIAVAGLAFPSLGLADTGEVVYRGQCAMCHDAGSDKAPRIDVRADWKARFSKGREGLLRSAIKGVPGTAMAPKAGFTQLPDAEVAEAVDYMLARVGFNADDVALARSVSEALERVGIHGVGAAAAHRAGLLPGVAGDQAAVTAAVAAARAVPGVREVENLVEPAQLFK